MPWRSLCFILALAGAVIYWIRGVADIPHQAANMRTTITLLITFVALLCWSLFAPGIPRRRRKVFILGLISPPLLAACLFRISGVTGDLLPILKPRWAGTRREAPLIPTQTIVSNVALGAASFPQFLGPLRTGVIPDSRVDLDWTKHPPKELWRTPVGPAWSGFAVAGNRALTMEQSGEKELVTCRDIASGQLLWRHADAGHYNTTIAGEGPRTTPSIAGQRVITLGGTGILNCLALEDGHVFWTTNVAREHHIHMPDWGVSSSPLVQSNRVIVFPGGGKGHAIAAYDLQSGRRIWSGGEDSSSYSSPVLATLAWRRQVLAFNSHSVSGHDLGSGALLWSFPWKGGHPHITLPLLVPTNRVLVSSGYGTGAALVEISRNGTNWSATEVWKSNKLKSKFANIIEHDGFLYGLDDGILTCVDLKDGSQRWKEGRLGHGQILFAHEMLLVMAESGELVQIKPDPERYEERGRLRIFTSKTWNPPALAGDYLIARNDQEAVCFLLAESER